MCIRDRADAGRALAALLTGLRRQRVRLIVKSSEFSPTAPRIGPETGKGRSWNALPDTDISQLRRVVPVEHVEVHVRVWQPTRATAVRPRPRSEVVTRVRTVPTRSEIPAGVQRGRRDGGCTQSTSPAAAPAAR